MSIANSNETLGNTVSYHWLKQLKNSGVDFVFANAGTDFPSIVEAFAKSSYEGKSDLLPKPILCAHENTAVSMAHGYAMVTGRAQVAMVHVNVGTANSINGLINAERDQIPMILAAGMTPTFEDSVVGARNLHIHWAQDMYDQPSMVRETVRGVFELRDPRLAHAITERALAIAHSKPCGPVYMMLPREVLAMEGADNSSGKISPASGGAPSLNNVKYICRLISEAKHPIIITSRAGFDQDVPDLLGKFATQIKAPVIEFKPRYANLDQEHEWHGGFEVSPWLNDADLIIVLDCDVPWIPLIKKPNSTTKIVHIGEDPIFLRYPLRTFPSDLSVRSSAREFLEAMLLDKSIYETSKSAQPGHSSRKKLRHDTKDNTMTMKYVSQCLDAVRDRDSVLVNEYPLVREAMSIRKPGSFYSMPPSGGLGWGVPAALGAKLAHPDREVIACVGDGSYIFCNPIATLQVAAAERIAILVVVFNNSGWKAVERATLSLYPDGIASKTNNMPLTKFDPMPDFSAVAEACCCRGWEVNDPKDLEKTLLEALSVVRSGTPAVVNVHCVS